MRPVIDAFGAEFARSRAFAERAAAQLSFDQLRVSLEHETNSIAVIMKHLGGNLRSRWTDPFTTDGEKPWRDRDREFIDDFPSSEALLAHWEAGWATLDAALRDMTDADLSRELRIRNEPHTLALALARSCAHAAYHAGQIVQTARVIASRAGQPWRTLTIERGGSVAFNRERGIGPTG